MTELKLDLARDYFRYEEDRLKTTDLKAQILLSTNTLFVSIIGLVSPSKDSHNIFFYIFLLLSLFLIVISGIFALMALRKSTYHIVGPEDICKNNLRDEQIIETFISCTKKNQETVNKKIDQVEYSSNALFASLFLLFLMVLVSSQNNCTDYSLCQSLSSKEKHVCKYDEMNIHKNNNECSDFDFSNLTVNVRIDEKQDNQKNKSINE